MSKPLELTIYPPLSPYTKQVIAWNLEQGYDAYRGISAEMHAPGLLAMKAKRLTDAELAAEYWAQVHDSQYAMTCELAAEDKPGRKAARHWGAQSTAKATTLHRFATRPHYFEADQ